MNYARSTLTTKNQISWNTLRVLPLSTLGREKTKMALVRATVLPSNKAIDEDAKPGSLGLEAKDS